jgi:GrpB-like predicted nucleotidyltransferase (UPF0157 family)
VNRLVEIVDYDERWPADFERLRDRLAGALGPIALAIERLAAIGFEHQGDHGIPGREAFRGPDGGDAYHAYVCTEGGEALHAHLAFRDHLRAYPEAAAEYAKLKRELAARFRDDRDGYTRAKSEFVERVVGS